MSSHDECCCVMDHNAGDRLSQACCCRDFSLEDVAVELIRTTRQTALNLRTQRDARLARLESRLETGGVQMREIGNPEMIDMMGEGHLVNDKFRSNVYTRSFIGGHEEEANGGHLAAGSCGINEARVGTTYWGRYGGTSLGSYNGPFPLGHMSTRVQYLSPLYVANRIRRAANFTKNHSVNEICGRLQCGWERRHGRAYPREEPPADTPDAPTIFRPMVSLTHNDHYPRPGWNVATTISLTRDKPFFTHSLFGQQRIKSGAYFSNGPSRFKFSPRLPPAINNLAKGASSK